MSVRRLEAETIRDALLAASGRLSAKMFGPPVPVMPDEVGQIVVGVDTRDSAGRPTGKVVPLGEDEFRRSIYVQVRRSQPLGMLEPFDAPTMSPNCEQRASLDRGAAIAVDDEQQLRRRASRSHGRARSSAKSAATRRPNSAAPGCWLLDAPRPKPKSRPAWRSWPSRPSAAEAEPAGRSQDAQSHARAGAVSALAQVCARRWSARTVSCT